MGQAKAEAVRKWGLILEKRWTGQVENGRGQAWSSNDLARNAHQAKI